MEEDKGMYVAIGVATLATLGGSLAGYHWHSLYAVPPIAGLGCGLLIWETIIDERKTKSTVKRGLYYELKYYSSCACAVAICFFTDLIPSGGGLGLLVSLLLNFSTDALISTKVTMVVATTFDNVALTYLLGSRARKKLITDFWLSVYLILPAIVYLFAMLIVQCSRLKQWAEKLKDSDSNGFTGFVMGIVLYTSLIELAPHMVEMDNTDKRYTAFALAGMFLIAPGVLLCLAEKPKDKQSDEKLQTLHDEKLQTLHDENLQIIRTTNNLPVIEF